MNSTQSVKYQSARAHKYQLELARYYRMPAVQTSLSVVMSLFLIAFFLVFALRPTLVTIVNLRKNIEESEKTLKQLETKVTALNRANALMDTLRLALPAIDGSIPTKSAGYQSLVSSVELLAQQSGVSIASTNLGQAVLFAKLYNPYAATPNASVISMPYSVMVEGPYIQVKAFLERLSKLDRIVMIESATFNHQSKSKTSLDETITLAINGEVYFMADQAQLARAIPGKKEGQ